MEYEIGPFADSGFAFSDSLVSVTSKTPAQWVIGPFTDAWTAINDVLASVSSFSPIQWVIGPFTDVWGSFVDRLVSVTSLRSVIQQNFLVQLVQRLWVLAAALMTGRKWIIAPLVRSFGITAANMPLLYADPKAAAEVQDYSFDWTATINAGDSIASSSWETAGLNQVQSSNTATGTTVRLGGGQPNFTYTCVNTVTMASGIILTQSIVVSISQ